MKGEAVEEGPGEEELERTAIVKKEGRARSGVEAEEGRAKLCRAWAREWDLELASWTYQQRMISS